jgi:hypothetical protein
MATVLYAKPGIRMEGKRAKWGYVIVTDEKIVHVSPKHIYPKIIMVGFVPFLIFGELIARKHADEWLANPPENARVVPLGEGAAVQPKRWRMGNNILGVVTPDGHEHVFGVPYKKAQKLLSQPAAGRQPSITPA